MKVQLTQDQQGVNSAVCSFISVKLTGWEGSTHHSSLKAFAPKNCVISLRPNPFSLLSALMPSQHSPAMQQVCSSYVTFLLSFSSKNKLILKVLNPSREQNQCFTKISFPKCANEKL